MRIVNLRNNKVLVAQYNPDRLEEEIGSEWSKLDVNGNSHQKLQFRRTNNLVLTFTLQFVAQTRIEMVRLHEARRTIHSWAYPRNVSNDIVGGGASRLLFIWPGMWSIETVAMRAKLTHNRFNVQARSVAFDATITLEEIRDFRITFGDVLEDNVLRFGNPDLEAAFGIEGTV